ncbi:MAG: TIGR00268 family protein, partial [Schwartzia sp.]|nr:TIGR00268 family protein [Schwartzia sp. (in: firmicutes)]
MVEEKLRALIDRLKACGSLVVALSGGVDSSTLAKAAVLALGEKAAAVTARSEFLSADELADAVAMARAAG